jgi:hypothetical protein
MPTAVGVAHAADALSVSTTVSNFTYTVQDLNKSDGIKAAVTFTPAAQDGLELFTGDYRVAGSDFYQSGVPVLVPGSMFGTGVQSATTPGVNALASKNGNTYTASAGFSATELNQILATSPMDLTARQAGEAYLLYNRMANIQYKEPSDTWQQGLNYTLAANTSVTFSGVVSTSFAMDLKPLLGTAGEARVLSLPVAGNVNVQETSYLLINPNANSDGANLFQTQYLNGKLDIFGQFTTEGSTTPSQKTFSFTVTNNSASPMQGKLKFELYNQIRLSVNPVPELTTVWMMGLGLTGVAFAVRRRQMLQA